MILDGATLFGGRSLATFVASEAHRALGLTRGWTAPPLTVVANVAPLPVWIQQGILVVSCPECVSTPREELHPVWRDGPHLMFCAVCGNGAVGGAWRPIVLPAHLDEIVAVLAGRPPQARTWYPGVPLADLVAENAEHSDAMMEL